MITLVCPQCGFKHSVTRREAEIQILCPKCHCQNLKAPIKERREKRVVEVRNSTIRWLIGGGVGIVVGPILLAISIPKLDTRAAVLWARVAGIGAIFTLAAIVALVLGIVGLVRDMK